MVYRRLKDSPDSGWHFHTNARVAKLGLVEAQFLKPDDDQICPECIKLDATPPPPTPSGGGGVDGKKIQPIIPRQ